MKKNRTYLLLPVSLAASIQMNLFWSFSLKLFYSLSLSETQAVLLAQLGLF